MPISLLFLYSVYGHLCGFQLGASINYSAINSQIYFFGENMYLFLWVIYRSGAWSV